MSTSEGWSDEARRTAAGVMRVQRLRPAARTALGRLLLDLFSGLEEAAFWKRWKALDLGEAEGLTHLAMLVDFYYRQLVRFQVAQDAADVSGVREVLALIAVYMGELEGSERLRPADLPVPASSPHRDLNSLPIPLRKP